jgi:hypothetical protein
VEGAIANYFNVPVTTPGMGEIARAIFTDVQQASRGNPAAWRSVVLSVLANHIGRAQGLIGGSELQRQLQIMRNSNRTDAAFARALAEVRRIVGSMPGGWRHVARAMDDGGTTNSNTYAVLGGYSASSLPVEMRRYLGQYDANHVAAVGNYLRSLGLEHHHVHQYAGFFVGSSETVRHAIREHRHNGRQITDADITSVNDARALIGAVQSRRISRDALPPSMQRLMEEMERGNVDLDNSESVRAYFQNNPDALERARRRNEADLMALSGTTRDGVLIRTGTDVTVQPPAPPSGQPPPEQPQPLTATVAPQPPRQTVSTLDLG